MKFLKGTLAAIATTAVMSGAPAAADGLSLSIDLGNGSVTLRGGDITINGSNGQLRGTFNNGQSNDNGTSCRNAAANHYNSLSNPTTQDYNNYRARIRACN